MTAFRVGDRVTFTANTRDNSYAYGLAAMERFNGTTGTVTALGYLMVYVKWDTPLNTFHRRPKSDGALSTFPENLTLIKEPTVTTFNPGDRVRLSPMADYWRRQGVGNAEGFVRRYSNGKPVVAWQGIANPGEFNNPPEHEIELVPSATYADTIADLRAKAAAKRAEADAFDTAADTLEKIK